MPFTVWFSRLALLYVLSMAGYHSVFLVKRFVLPAPSERAEHGVKNVLWEWFFTLAILIPLLRRVVPYVPWVRGSTTAPALAFYVAVFAWLPLMKAFVLCTPQPAERKNHTMAVLYSVPMSILYLVGVGYVLGVTAWMSMFY